MVPSSAGLSALGEGTGGGTQALLGASAPFSCTQPAAWGRLLGFVDLSRPRSKEVRSSSPCPPSMSCQGASEEGMLARTSELDDALMYFKQ